MENAWEEACKRDINTQVLTESYLVPLHTSATRDVNAPFGYDDIEPLGYNRKEGVDIRQWVTDRLALDL